MGRWPRTCPECLGLAKGSHLAVTGGLGTPEFLLLLCKILDISLDAKAMGINPAVVRKARQKWRKTALASPGPLCPPRAGNGMLPKGSLGQGLGGTCRSRGLPPLPEAQVSNRGDCVLGRC